MRDLRNRIRDLLVKKGVGVKGASAGYRSRLLPRSRSNVIICSMARSVSASLSSSRSGAQARRSARDSVSGRPVASPQF